MAAPGADDEEYVQLTVPEVFVYKVPPRTSAQGHKAADWKEQVWVGKLQVVTRDRVGEAAVKLVNPETGKIFAVAPVRKNGPPAAEKVTDSSRYFCLRIENDKGQHAFIGVGFNNRSDAFDFNVALQDWAKHSEAEAPGGAEALLDLGPVGQDFSLKAGEKITIKVNVNASGGGKAGAASSTGGGGLKPLAGPGGGGGLRPPGKLAPPGSAAAAAPSLRAPSSAAAAPAAAAGDDLLGLGGGVAAMSLGGGSAAPKPAAAPALPADDWVSF